MISAHAALGLCRNYLEITFGCSCSELFSKGMERPQWLGGNSPECPSNRSEPPFCSGIWVGQKGDLMPNASGTDLEVPKGKKAERIYL